MPHYSLLSFMLASPLCEQKISKWEVAQGQRIGGVSTHNGQHVGMEKLQFPIDLLDQRLEWKGDAGQLNINETYYNLTQCHWHTPSEHTLNGTKFALELHEVHTTSKGEFVVIGILYKIGLPDRFLSKVCS
ncbi:Alpha carbonic anhydrase 4 [Glycine max]|nr:Alpha carbonic anhydrase 4 [Glycine max]